MRLAASAAVVIFATVWVFAANDGPPPWAYGFSSPPAATGAPATPPAPPAPAAPAPDVAPRQIPGSPGPFTLAQIRDGFGPADRFPVRHPAMPATSAPG